MAHTVDYSYFINSHSARRRPALTRVLTKLAYNLPKEAISLAEGMPCESTFPFEKINVVLKGGCSFSINEQQMGAALQYLPTRGYPPLLETLKEFTRLAHSPPSWDQKDIIITNGSQDGISKAIEMCVQEGDSVLVQNPFYGGIEVILHPFRITIIPVEQDHLGLVPQVLRTVLENWKIKCETEGETCRMPKLIYLNPTGSNPTGTTIPLERKTEIYEICSEYNILILEDDAYYYMNFSQETPPSFLSLDTEGRVLRFDSLSKVVSPGLRLGWVTAAKPLIQNIELHIQSAHLHSSTLSQFLTYSLLQNWGFEKLLEHYRFVKDYYQRRRDLTLLSMERHLKGLCEWSVPSGGMFVWIKVKGVADVYEMLMNRGLKKMITLSPGHAFMADSTQACSYIRAAYSKASPKQIDKAMSILAELIKEEKLLLRRKLESFT